MKYTLTQMESEKTMSKNSSLICVVCGDGARGMNFDVITCMSCKAFFRRHAHQQSVSFSFPKKQPKNQF